MKNVKYRGKKTNAAQIRGNAAEKTVGTTNQFRPWLAQR